MHTAFYRGNAVITFSIFILGILCTLASYSDRLHVSNPDIEISVVRTDLLWKIPRGPLRGNDEAFFTLKIKADFTSVFSWNTKQLFVAIVAEFATPKNDVNRVSIWDTIIESKEEAVIELEEEQAEYTLMDQGNNLRGRSYNLTVEWNIMPITGGFDTKRRTFTGFQLPESYTH